MNNIDEMSVNAIRVFLEQHLPHMNYGADT